MRNIADNRLFRIIHEAENLMLATSLALIFVLTIVNIVLRYLFKTGMLWSDELIGFNLLFIGVMGAAGNIRDKGHTCMDGFVSRFPPKLQTVTYFAVQAAVILLLVYFIYSGILFTQSVGTQKSFVLKWPMVIFYGMIPAGFALCLIEELLVIFKDILNGDCRFKSMEEQQLELPEQQKS